MLFYALAVMVTRKLISVLWGFVLWREVPTLTTAVGAALTLLSGLYLLYQDR